MRKCVQSATFFYHPVLQQRATDFDSCHAFSEYTWCPMFGNRILQHTRDFQSQINPKI